jgi:hypothetical protein
MRSARKVLSLLLALGGVAWLALAAAALTARHIGEPGKVSQVFTRLLSVPLGPGLSLRCFEVAVTPDAPGRTVVICKLLTLSGKGGLDLLEREVWLLPLETETYAYHETAKGRSWVLVLLGVGLALIALSVPLYPPN